MKQLKQWMAAMLAFILVLGVYATPALAAGKIPSAEDKGTVTIQNVVKGATVTAYRIVEPTYGAAGFTGYKMTEKLTTAIPNAIADTTTWKPTDVEITAIAARSAELDPGTVLATEEAIPGNEKLVNYKGELPVGVYLVLVSGNTGETVYNPMVVSVYYTTSDNTTMAGTVNSNSNWGLTTENAFAKSSEVTLDKSITGHSPADNVADAGNHGDDIAIGDTVNFKIDTTIPSYSQEYKKPHFKLSDSMDKGLTLNEDNIVVKVGGQKLEADNNYELTHTAQSFEINFKEAYLKSLAGKTAQERKVEVTYEATLNEEATQNLDANMNTAKVEFSNDPKQDDGYKTIEDRTYQYTFEIDGKVDGSQKKFEHRLHEIIKTKENGLSDDEKRTIDDGTFQTDEIKSGLEGAIFELKNTKTNKTYYAKSDANGLFGAGEDWKGHKVTGFKGLDAGLYTLKEVEAPANYSLNTQEHAVEIMATYETAGVNKGRMISYTITIDGTATSTYTAEYESDKSDVITKVTPAEQSLAIKNIKVPELPSTGGMGTYLFTAVGVVMMTVAAGFYFSKRNRVNA